MSNFGQKSGFLTTELIWFVRNSRWLFIPLFNTYTLLSAVEVNLSNSPTAADPFVLPGFSKLHMLRVGMPRPNLPIVRKLLHCPISLCASIVSDVGLVGRVAHRTATTAS